jgi:hypothetical protein
MTSPHTRNVPSDADPEVLWTAVEKRTRPEFIEREGFSRCPRCKRLWPDADFRPDHATFPPVAPQARCLDCRKGLKRALRQAAREQGICEAYGCAEPVHRKYKCREHYRLSCEAHARRNAAATV